MYDWPMSFTPRRPLANARRLRREQVPAEARLWTYLRDRRLKGFKFVRQVPIGAYIVDFLCRETKLVVEVDGATHSDDREITYDRRREAYLREQGFALIRVHNADVYQNINDVLDGIVLKLEGTS
jgi:very-short-patch-repair endonuclease